MTPAVHSSSSYAADPLPDALRNSMVPVAIVAILSFFCTGALLLYLLSTYPRAKNMRRKFSPQYQNVVLIFNLLLGDFIQSLGFSLNSTWLLQRRVYLGFACDLQGTLIQVGDLLGSLCVMSIAFHTFTYVVLRKRISRTMFFCWITSIWLMSLVLGIVMPIIVKRRRDRHDFYWSLAGSWCWIRADYGIERLLTHYIFIFFVQIVCIVVYLAIYAKLVLFSRRVGEELGSGSNGKVEKAARLMLIYPLAYIFCTLPLATIRVYSMLGGHISLTMSAVFGSIFTSSGLINSVLYGLTRALRRRRRPITGMKGIRLEPQKLREFDPLEYVQEQYKVVATIKSDRVEAEKHRKKKHAQVESTSPSEQTVLSTQPLFSPIHVESETIMRSEAFLPKSLEMNKLRRLDEVEPVERESGSKATFRPSTVLFDA